jgi:hypothetical protein
MGLLYRLYRPDGPKPGHPATTKPAAGALVQGRSLRQGQQQNDGHGQAQHHDSAQHQGRDQSDDQPLEYR